MREFKDTLVSLTQGHQAHLAAVHAKETENVLEMVRLSSGRRVPRCIAWTYCRCAGAVGIVRWRAEFQRSQPGHEGGQTSSSS
jgi:hypothetical protein